MRPFSPRMFPDTVSVLPSGATADLAGGPVQPSAGGGTLVSCSVQLTGTTGQATRRQEIHGSVEGSTDYVLLFPADPGIPAADRLLLWTAHAGKPLTPPLVLASQGPARPPSGLLVRWSVDAQHCV